MNEEVDKTIHNEHLFTSSMRMHNPLPIYHGLTTNGHMKKRFSETTIKVLNIVETLISWHHYARKISDKIGIHQGSINQ